MLHLPSVTDAVERVWAAGVCAALLLAFAAFLTLEPCAVPPKARTPTGALPEGV